MTIEQMSEYINQIHKNSAEYKTLAGLLATFSEVKQLEKEIVKIQQKINEIVDVLNRSGIMNQIDEAAAPVQQE